MIDAGAKLEAPPAKAALAPNPPEGARRKRTIILSDVHLSQAHPDDPSDPLWMRYRRAEFHPDEDFAALVDHVLAAYAGDAIELVFNGDVLDFDAPWVKEGTSSFDEFPLDDAGCAAQATRILQDHPGWFGAVAKLLLAGHRVLFTSGNHDLELYWPGVRAAIRAHLVALCASEAARMKAQPVVSPDVIATSIEARLRFRAWFHVTEDKLFIEHGSQYDIYNGVPWPMLPIDPIRRETHPVMGKLAFKRTGSRMGYFNPYYEETFYLGLSGYFWHFWTRYAKSPTRHIARTWFMGAVTTSLEVLRGRNREDWSADNRAAAQAENGATVEQIDATQALRADLAERTMIPVLRELWLDRLILIVAVLLITPTCGAIFGWLGAAIGLVGCVLAFVAYEVFTPKPDIRTYDSAPPSVKALFDIHGVRAICFGHTHRPSGEWDEKERFYGNSGSWCPAFLDEACTKPVLDKRPLLMLVTEGEHLEGGLFSFRREADALGSERCRLEPVEGAARVEELRTRDGDTRTPASHPTESALPSPA